MCGLAAIVAAPHAALDPGLIRAMTTLVRHRGPDGDGYATFHGAVLDPRPFGGTDTPAECFHPAHAFLPRSVGTPDDGEVRLALGHRRLAIVDLSAGGYQPMALPERDLWVVYNGEIYNHIELRGELESLGHVFRSHSDTEVLLAAYRQWGEECLPRLNGMFAFVMVDRRAKRLFCARDRFGVKPLYYWQASSGLLAFASEIKQFSVLPGWQALLNGPRAHDFLASGLSDHTDETLFEGVRQLRGGELVCVDLPTGEQRHSRWYDVRPRRFSGTLQEAAREFGELFEDSVRLRLRADVSVGSCLSGGLDSSSIVCVAAGLLREHGVLHAQKTFSARSRVANVDEGPYIDHAVRASGAESHVVYPDLGALHACAAKLTWHQDEPFGSTSIYAQWDVFSLAARHRMKVMLDGQGADETLAGYEPYFGARLAGLAAGWQLTALAREYAAIRRVRPYALMELCRELARAVFPSAAYRAARAMRGRPGDVQSWVNLPQPQADPDSFAPRRGSPLHSLSLAQLTTTNLPMLLHWEDRNSMAHSVEARLPFLDYRLVEFIVGQPEEHLLSGGLTKRVLREAMRGTVPEPILARTDKIGFGTPEETWMTQGGRELFREWVARAIEQSRGILKPAALSRAEEILEGRAPFSFLVWRLISFGQWMEGFRVHPP